MLNALDRQRTGFFVIRTRAAAAADAPVGRRRRRQQVPTAYCVPGQQTAHARAPASIPSP